MVFNLLHRAASLQQNHKESYWVEHHNPSSIRPLNPSKVVKINFFHALISVVVVVVHTAAFSPVATISLVR